MCVHARVRERERDIYRDWQTNREKHGDRQIRQTVIHIKTDKKTDREMERDRQMGGGMWCIFNSHVWRQECPLHRCRWAWLGPNQSVAFAAAAAAAVVHLGDKTTHYFTQTHKLLLVLGLLFCKLPQIINWSHNHLLPVISLIISCYMHSQLYMRKVNYLIYFFIPFYITDHLLLILNHLKNKLY